MSKQHDPDLQQQITQLLQMAQARGQYERGAYGGGMLGGGLVTPRANRWLATFWQPTSKSADIAINRDLPYAHAQVDELLTTSPLAAGAQAVKTSITVGPGGRWVSQIDAETLGITPERARAWERQAMREQRLAMESVWIDVERRLPFSRMQRLLYESKRAKGDVFLVFTRKGRPDLPYRLGFQIIEAEYCCNPYNARDGEQADGNILSAGFEMKPDGEPIQIWFADVHPGERTRSKTREWFPVRVFRRNGRPNILHYFDRRRPGQTRGWSSYVTVINLIKQLTNYTDSEVDAAVRAALNVLFIKTRNMGAIPSGVGGFTMGDTSSPHAHPENPNEKIFDDMSDIYPYVRELDDVDTIETPTPGRPNQAAGEFILAMMTQVAMAVELPVEVLLQRFTASYTAASAAVNFAHEYVIDDQTHLNQTINDPCVVEWMAEAVFRNRLRASGFFSDPIRQQAWTAGYWQYKPKTIILEREAANAAKTRIESRISSPQYEARNYSGNDWLTQTVPDLKEAAEVAEELAPAPDNDTFEPDRGT